ncbi:dTMP kinase [Nocardia asteroides NBRC 15531]|uniref:Thymidylate kinase n=1 Tax=Nocardia asteroides NBRC 15531 TaxID=1110697 RepID=U5EJY4_NOCAS|nr:dTMP kinase [Nocardia asteroides]TLF70186.1 dTMP kinase [Nocardia asteroides NBRC 15531]UGT49715.1 dTMP kinase [Nocardia asteroides]SFL99234.1 dTMP kinase [Nocardia asteroides]VEG37561.1 Thymidylate kinase [Nocardia asteroides]BAO98877.1 thymidylate kinase [Nocardia asteroides NBRC 15531]
MGVLITVEGLDGAGKRTLIDGLITELSGKGLRAGTLAFPRYGRSIHADLAAEALRGGHGDLAGSINAMAIMFALDRAEASAELSNLLDANDIVVLDRWVASNAAYSAARAAQDADGEIVSWVGDLEYGRLALPVPDLTVLIDLPTEVAAERARRRGELDSARALDAYERDGGLQHRTGEVYRELADRDWFGRWWTYRSDDDRPALLTLCSEIAAG